MKVDSTKLLDEGAKELFDKCAEKVVQLLEIVIEIARELLKLG